MAKADTPLDPTGAGEPIVVVIPVTDAITQVKLERFAQDALVPYSVHADGGIEITCPDQATADFWTERGAIWGKGYPDPETETAATAEDAG